jgi:hypothetical protein
MYMEPYLGFAFLKKIVTKGKAAVTKAKGVTGFIQKLKGGAAPAPGVTNIYQTAPGQAAPAQDVGFGFKKLIIPAAVIAGGLVLFKMFKRKKA